MRFLLELPENNRPVSIEVHALKDAIENSRQEEYKMAVPNYFSNLDEFHSLPQTLKTSLEETVPVGSIDFVQSYLRKVHGVDVMHPIEIPERLRIPKILLRDYHIVRYEHLPKEGRWFVKDVSKLKNGSFAGQVTKDTYKDFDPTHLYQFSSLLNIISEYRVFVYRDRIQGIQFYDGDVLTMPTPAEIKKIQEAVVRYSVARDCPDAYTMDWAIVATGDKKEPRDIALLEVHPFVSVGTYGLEGSILIPMYKSGIQWYLQHNTPLNPEEPEGESYAFF